MLLVLLSVIVVVVCGQLSVDELFYFKSKHAVSGNCSDLQYTFADLEIGSMIYNQLEFDCDSSSIIFRNSAQTPSTECPQGESEKQNLQLRFHRFIKILSTNTTLIEVKPIHLYGIELASLDDLIRNVYREYAFYHSRWALLIDIEGENNRRHHVALASDGDLTFLLCILLLEHETAALVQGDVQIVFPNEHIFGFNRSSLDIWRIDEGFVHHSKLSTRSNPYQLSRSSFSLYNNEIFVVYGIKLSESRRFVVSIDKTAVACQYSYILHCTFPVLPLDTSDTNQPRLKVHYNFETIINTTLSLIPRVRLGNVPHYQNLSEIAKFQININEELCRSGTLKSLFTFTIHMRYEDANSTAQYQRMEDDEMQPVECNTTASVGQRIESLLTPVSVKDIVSIDLDLNHQWYGQANCRIERTQIRFLREEERK